MARISRDRRHGLQRSFLWSCKSFFVIKRPGENGFAGTLGERWCLQTFRPRVYCYAICLMTYLPSFRPACTKPVPLGWERVPVR